MRSQDFRYNLRADSAELNTFSTDKLRSVTVNPDGSFHVMYSTDTEGAKIVKYHLDTDDGFDLFVRLITNNAKAELAAEVRDLLNIRI